jgi:hypothetical protein
VLEDLGDEALAVAVLEVHALEHRRPILRLGAARASLDVDEAVVGVERIGEHAAEFERRDVLLDFGGLGSDLLERCLVVIGPGEAEELRRVREAGVDAPERADYRFQRLLFLAQLLRALGVIPELWVFELAIERV